MNQYKNIKGNIDRIEITSGEQFRDFVQLFSKNMTFKKFKAIIQNNTGVCLDFRKANYAQNDYGAYPVMLNGDIKKIVDFVHNLRADTIGVNDEMAINEMRTSTIKIWLQNQHFHLTRGKYIS